MTALKKATKAAKEDFTTIDHDKLKSAIDLVGALPAKPPSKEDEQATNEYNEQITEIENKSKPLIEDFSENKGIQNVVKSVFAIDMTKSKTGAFTKPATTGGKRSKKHAKNHKKHKTKKNN